MKLPKVGLVFWPVGNGDSTTIVVGEGVVIQVDLNHLADSDDEDGVHEPVVDRLAELLPKGEGDRPYLSAFVLTHPDKDHCTGFADLMDKVDIGELWFSPRVFAEYKADLCDDAAEFKDEATRRVKETIEAGGDPGSGNRVRVIGYSDLLEDDEFTGFPDEFLAVPGSLVSQVDGEEVSDRADFFIHAPFKDDAESERNETSIAFRLGLRVNGGEGRAMFLGDLPYPILKRIFKISGDEDVAWDVLLVPHHCSKSAMYWPDEEGAEEKLQEDILKFLKGAAGAEHWLISSSEPVPPRDSEGANPPHAKAKARYEESFSKGRFLCTQEHLNDDKPAAICFDLGKTWGT